MISNHLMYALIVQYCVIAGVSAYERNGPRALYFVGAALLSVAVLWMSE